ncbi:phytanoyl-CoA dioxygenase family protein [Nocardioides marmotae]|uniref:phytanoyl-CoA dioxygenase family protein n=1 Tax=Nocardioides marmotae TaxID=2663857 RepID=UPI0012B6590F|nr:phytanoyl-CoA dioxygenase family protein [Nocardioides marmotae]MBC9735444.1 phytanoyl-CoA dioxygenase family protein [Nocardioides marmotae]MTB86541.1 phytanoyl-CoA dioxygenase [Nocardioides marmotae]
MPTPAQLDVPIDTGAIAATLHRDGILGCPGAFAVDWVDRLREDVEAAYAEARAREGGAVGRGPQRWYVEVHPEALRGFADLVGHPWVQAVCETVLGPEWMVVEVGFDVPFPGARDQPWHRDFPSPRETWEGGRLTSLAFNLTCVDTVEEMGPFEVAPGTHWERGEDFEHGMFPPRGDHPRLQEAAVRKYPRRGDVSVRSALTLHRGTANVGEASRPVLVLGVDAPGAGHADLHDLAVTAAYREALPAAVRDHLDCRVVDRLVPIVQKHTIEGLVMGEE